MDRTTTSKTVTSRFLLEESFPSFESEASNAVQARAGSVLRPAGALATFDGLAAWVAGWQGTSKPSIERPAIVVFAADHGVVDEGVSAFGSEVNAAMLEAFQKQKASISAIASCVGATVTAVDVGVGKPTGNLRVEPALTETRFADSFEAGRAAVRAESADLLVFGEMGIGNTTAAAALTAGLMVDPSDRSRKAIAPFVGRGSGIDDAQHQNKVDVVFDALDRIGDEANPLQLLTELGGSELAAIAGAVVEARSRSIPVLLDGYIATAPVLALDRISSTLVEHVRAGHVSAEPGHRLALDHLGVQPLLQLDMRLGEGSGAAAAIPLVSMACALVTDVPTFDEWFGSS